MMSMHNGMETIKLVEQRLSLFTVRYCVYLLLNSIYCTSENVYSRY
jgi:hypothetical protein